MICTDKIRVGVLAYERDDLLVRCPARVLVDRLSRPFSHRFASQVLRAIDDRHANSLGGSRFRGQ